MIYINSFLNFPFIALMKLSHTLLKLQNKCGVDDVQYCKQWEEISQLDRTLIDDHNSVRC